MLCLSLLTVRILSIYSDNSTGPGLLGLAFICWSWAPFLRLMGGFVHSLVPCCLMGGGFVHSMVPRCLMGVGFVHSLVPRCLCDGIRLTADRAAGRCQGQRLVPKVGC